MKKILIVLFLIVILFITSCTKSNPKTDEFAKCLTENGAKFYGAFWCPHCAEQKKMFGSSFEYVNYIECSTPDRSGQVPICINANIEGYPTWGFSDDSRLTGVQSFLDLSEKTGCPLSE